MYLTKTVRVASRLAKLNEEGWYYAGLPGLQWEAENARKADPKVMREIVDEVSADPRFGEFYNSCINCGNCTAVCPPFRLVDFAPRIVVQKVMAAKEEPELLYQMMDQYIWSCYQCYACWEVCPAKDNPGGLVALLRESSVKHGLQSAKKTLEPYSKILYKIMATGTQITPDMHSSNAPFRDWGGGKAELAKHMREENAAVPVETMAGVMDKSWRVDKSTMRELITIEKEAGVIEMVKQSLKDVADMVEEAGEELGVKAD